MNSTYRMLVVGYDRPSLAPSITSFIAKNKGWTKNIEYVPVPDTDQVAVRVEVDKSNFHLGFEDFKRGFCHYLEKNNLQGIVRNVTEKTRIAIFDQSAERVIRLLDMFENGGLDGDIGLIVTQEHPYIKLKSAELEIPVIEVSTTKSEMCNHFIQSQLQRYSIDVTAITGGDRLFSNIISNLNNIYCVYTGVSGSSRSDSGESLLTYSAFLKQPDLEKVTLFAHCNEQVFSNAMQKSDLQSNNGHYTALVHGLRTVLNDNVVMVGQKAFLFSGR